MKVKCIKPLEGSMLEYGKVYDVEDYDFEYYTFDRCYFNKNRFEIVKEIVGDNKWKIT